MSGKTGAIVLTFAILLVPSVGSTRTWYIRPDGTGDAPTISAGEDSAASGDTLLLADGVYSGEGNTHVTLYGKALYIKSESNDPEACILDCTGGGTFMFIAGCEGVWAWGGLFGLKITGASTAVLALCYASGIAYDCIITGASGTAMKASASPGGDYASVTARRCIFSGNSCAMSGGYKCNVTAIDCVFYDNGCAISLTDEGAWSQVARCTIVLNNGGAAGALRVVSGFSPSGYLISRSIIAFNTGRPAGVDYCGCYSLECSDVYGNTLGDYVGCFAGKNGVDGNFSADPLFCNLFGVDYRIQEYSPCAPDSHPDGVPCGLIGALPVGCIPDAVEPTTWGSIKAMYR